MAVDEQKLMDFLHRFVGDLGAAIAAGSVVVGHRLGLYRALAEEPATPQELAARTETDPRYITEWLYGQAAGGYVTYDGGRFSLSEEQAFALANPTVPCTPPALSSSRSPRSAPSKRSPRRSAQVPGSTGTSTTPTCSSAANSSSAPGTSRISYRVGFPPSTAYRTSFVPVPESPTSAAGSAPPPYCWSRSTRSRRGIGGPRPQAGRGCGVADRVTFEVANAQGFSGHGYDLVATFDCLHDMGDSLGAARHIREALAPEGTWLIVEPAAGDSPDDNLNPVGRVYYLFSTFLCVPNALSQSGRVLAGRPGGRGGDPTTGDGCGLHPVPPRL